MVAGRRGWLLAAIAALWLADASGAAALDKLRVGKPEATGFSFALLDVGMAQGIFAHEGLELESLDFAGGAKSHQALVADGIDIELGAGVEFGFIAKGSPAKGIAMMAGPPLSFAIIVRADHDIAKVDDLKGKLIGVSTVGSLTYWLASEFARSNGWGSDGVKPTPVGNMDSEVAALIAKNVDGIVGPTERGYPLQAAGRARVLVTFGRSVPDFITHMIVTSNRMIAQHPDDIRRFLKGWFETVAYVKSHKAETIRLTADITRMPPDIAAKVYDEQMPMFNDDGHFDPKAVAVIKRSLTELGQFTTNPDDKLLFTEEFLPR